MHSIYSARWRHALSAALLLSSLFAAGFGVMGASQAAHAGAALSPVVTASATSIQPGTFVTVHAVGFLPGEPVQLAFIQTNAAGATTQTSVLLVPTANSSGALTIVIAVPVNTAVGTYQIRAYGLSSHRVAYEQVRIAIPMPTLSVSPADFGPGVVIRVMGRGFFPYEMVTLTIQSPSGTARFPLRQAQANTYGVFSTTVRVPSGPAPGTEQIVAVGQTSNREGSIIVRFAVQAASVTVTPSSVKPGDVVILNVAHFQPRELIVVELVTASRTVAMRPVPANSRGGLTAYRLTIPATVSGGTATIIVTGRTTHVSAAAHVTIIAATSVPGLTLSSTRVTPGATLTVQGIGFTPGEAVSIGLQGPVVRFALTTALASATGTIYVPNIQVPPVAAAGTYWITATGEISGHAVSAVVNVT